MKNLRSNAKDPFVPKFGVWNHHESTVNNTRQNVKSMQQCEG